MKLADTNTDGFIDYEEWISYLDKSAPLEENWTSCDAVKASFRIWDKNGDGMISKQELNEILEMVAPSVTKQEIRMLWRHMDADSNGKVDPEEFCNFIFAG